MTPNQTDVITAADLRVTPFFERFIKANVGRAKRFPAYNGEMLFAPDGDVTASTQAGIEETQFKLLSEAIPALTFAAAANEVTSFGQIRNIHMQDFQKLWPLVRTSQSRFGTRWLHSDIKDVSFSYVSRLYDGMVILGELK